jgi:hypothetical protein
MISPSWTSVRRIRRETRMSRSVFPAAFDSRRSPASSAVADHRDSAWCGSGWRNNASTPCCKTAKRASREDVIADLAMQRS